MVRNINFLSFLVHVFEIVILCLKRNVRSEFPQKYFKTTERHSLAVSGSLWGEIYFLFIFIPFTGMIKKSCLNKSKFS